MISARVRHALMLALLFFVISSPYTYTFVDRVVSGTVGQMLPNIAHLVKVAEGGSPTTYGLLVHSLVFGLAAYYLHQ